MLKIKEINNGFSYTLSFMIEFLGYMERSKVEEVNFVEFMEVMYGSIEDFQKYNLKDMTQEFEKICYYLKTYEKIADLVEKSDGNE